jgi:hypothetical protein
LPAATWLPAASRRGADTARRELPALVLAEPDEP